MIPQCSKSCNDNALVANRKIRLAADNDWPLEEGWALYLVSHFKHPGCCILTHLKQGSHFVRCGVENLGSELQRRGIALHSQRGAQGIVYEICLIMGSLLTITTQELS